jgi:hypothetical protein
VIAYVVCVDLSGLCPCRQGDRIISETGAPIGQILLLLSSNDRVIIRVTVTRMDLKLNMDSEPWEWGPGIPHFPKVLSFY